MEIEFFIIFTIFVSHLSSIFVDTIIVLDNGQICEVGSHKELIRKGGKYASLYEMQSSQYSNKEGNKGFPSIYNFSEKEVDAECT